MKKKLWHPDQPLHPVYNRSYILHLWRGDLHSAADWRASLEIPETGERIGFASLEQLFAYLMDLSERSGDMQQGVEKRKEI